MNAMVLQKVIALIVMMVITFQNQIDNASNVMKDVLTVQDQMTMTVQLAQLDIIFIKLKFLSMYINKSVQSVKQDAQNVQMPSNVKCV